MKKSLFFQDGGSDKEYHAQVVLEETGFSVNFQYGRRGAALQSGTKTPQPVSQVEAEKIFIKLCNEKIRKGYVPDDNSEHETGSPFVKNTEVIFAPQLLNEIENPQSYIDNDSYLAQEKFDGERRMVISTSEGVIGVNKKGQSVPVSDGIKDSINCHCIIDGEIVGGKIFAFDIVDFEGDISDTDLISRLYLLNKLKFGNDIVVVKTAYTHKEKQAMFDRIKAENGEGIVFKLNATYTHGRPNSGGPALKFKFHKTGTFIVANMTTGKRSVGLEMIDSTGSRVAMGKVTIPPNKDIPEVGDLVEVRYLYAFPSPGSIFQPVYLDKRTDADLTDCETKQIIYKKD